MGGIIGGNTFDTLFLTIADAGYRDGSLYHAISNADLFWNAVALVMTALLMLGLLLRQEGKAQRKSALRALHCFWCLAEPWRYNLPWDNTQL